MAHGRTLPACLWPVDGVGIAQLLAMKAKLRRLMSCASFATWAMRKNVRVFPASACGTQFDSRHGRQQPRPIPAGNAIQVRYICERGHLPAEHGILEFDSAANAWTKAHVDRRVQRMAECFLAVYLERRKAGRRGSRKLNVNGHRNEIEQNDSR